MNLKLNKVWEYRSTLGMLSYPLLKDTNIPRNVKGELCEYIKSNPLTWLPHVETDNQKQS